ncbi:MAG: tetratricopeptide repeat protein [Dehalococcoidia bacterium]|nr:tetratricopeptide repeat protein [Dehalococcoidia bacterium]
MTQYTSEDKVKLRRQRTELAISLAMRNRWEEALLANQSILELYPEEVEAHNRIGKALTELGRYGDAASSYRQALELDPNNTIAQRNLARLSQAPRTEGVPVEKRDSVDPRLFIEETGKTGFTNLVQTAGRDVLARMSAGDRVSLTVAGRKVNVENARGQHLGEVEPRLALRLINLMNGGNQYASAITSLSQSGIRIIIKETFQHPDQVGKVSFPSKGPTDNFRPYIKESLLRYGLEGDEEESPDDEFKDWEEGEGVAEEPEYVEDDGASEEREEDLGS